MYIKSYNNTKRPWTSSKNEESGDRPECARNAVGIEVGQIIGEMAMLPSVL